MFHVSGFALECLDGVDPQKASTLLPLYKSLSQDRCTPYPLPCDTLWVPAGSETVVEENVCLYHADRIRNKNPAIVVKGSLHLRGRVGHDPVRAEESFLSFRTGGREDRAWGGIKVEPCGVLRTGGEAAIHHALRPLEILSPYVEIERLRIVRGAAISLPDSSVLLPSPDSNSQGKEFATWIENFDASRLQHFLGGRGRCRERGGMGEADIGAERRRLTPSQKQELAGHFVHLGFSAFFGFFVLGAGLLR